MRNRLILIAVVALVVSAAALTAVSRSHSSPPPGPSGPPTGFPASIVVVDENGKPVKCPNGSTLKLTREQLTTPPEPGTAKPNGKVKKIKAPNGGVGEEVTDSKLHHWNCGSKNEPVLSP